MLDAERRRILEIRKSGTVDSEVIADVLATLDIEESMLDSAEAERDETAAYAARRWTTGDLCPDLEQYQVDRGRSRRRTARPASTRAPSGSRYGAASSAATSPAATPRRSSTPPRTSTTSTHPVMQSAEPGEDWRWCFVHHLTA